MSYRHILRYLICPTHHPEDRVEELAKFCQAARVDEVMILFFAEELTNGHPTIEEMKPWVELMKKIKSRLAQVGVDLSVNPWTTTFHVARGRRLKPGQDFTLMVGETGAVARISACPLCENWRKYLCELFAHVAAEVKPVAIWVEDDWRLHNHEPEMKFGGCFCDLHLKRFAGMVNRQSVTRQEVLDAILAPGRPHPWRAQWLELWRQTMIEPALELRQAVQRANASTRLALMSSTPDVHSMEGRDWHALQDALGFEPVFLTRPHLAPYTENCAIQAPPDCTRLTIANLKRPLGIYPELENSPRCGVYSKSKTYTTMECLESVCYGSHGITINHFDMMGNGTGLDRGFERALSEPKDVLDAVVKLGIDDDRAQGAAVLYSPDVARYRHASPSAAKEMGALRNNSQGWSSALAILGIGYGFVRQPVSDRPVFVCDQTLRAFDDQAINSLLSGVLVCDAPSVEILLERGLGGMIGVQSLKGGILNDLAYAYEEITNGSAGTYGLERPRMSASRCSHNIIVMQPAGDASVRTMLKTADHDDVAPGMIVYRNSLGGVVVSTAYPLGQAQFYMGYFNCFRQMLWQELLFELCPSARLIASREFPLRVYRTRLDSGEFIGVINPTLDVRDETHLKLGGSLPAGRIELLDRTGRWLEGKASASACPVGWK